MLQKISKNYQVSLLAFVMIASVSLFLISSNSRAISESENIFEIDYNSATKEKIIEILQQSKIENSNLNEPSQGKSKQYNKEIEDIINTIRVFRKEDFKDSDIRDSIKSIVDTSYISAKIQYIADFEDIPKSLIEITKFEEELKNKLNKGKVDEEKVHLISKVRKNFQDKLASKTTIENSNWKISETKSEMSDLPTFVGHADAVESITVGRKTIEPSLFIRCSENQTEVYMTTGTSLHPVYGRYDEAEIRYRIDESPSVSTFWDEGVNGKSVFASKPIKFLKEIYNADAIKIEFTPYSQHNVIAEFDLNGVKPVIEKTSDTCNWRL